MNGTWRKRIGIGLVIAAVLGAAGVGLAQIAFYQKIALGTTPCMLSGGAGTPEGAVTGSPCDLYLRNNGAAGTTLYVKETGAATNTGWGAAATSATTVLTTSGGTGLTSYAVGDLLYYAAGTALSKLPDVAAGSYLRSGGVTTAPVWSTLTLPNTVASGDLLKATAANTVTALGFTDGYILTANATGPKWSRDVWTAYQGAARCQGASATSLFNLPNAATAAAANCTAGANQIRGVLDYSDASNHTAQVPIHLTDDWDSTGATTLNIYWSTAVGNAALAAIWSVQTACVGVTEPVDKAWNAAQAISSNANASADYKIKAQTAALTMTGCSADETLWIKIDRDGTVGGDTLAGTASLIAIEVQFFRKWT